MMLDAGRGTEAPAAQLRERSAAVSGRFVVFAALVVALAVAGTGITAWVPVLVWHWNVGLGLLLLAGLLVEGRRMLRDRPGASAPWVELLDARRYEEALPLLVAAVHAHPERLEGYVAIIDLYLRDDVDLPEDALVWLDAAIDRADEGPMVAELLLRRAEILHRVLGDSRRALVDLITVEKRFPQAPVADRAVALRERMRVTARAR